jgi:hypothetical protein
MYFSCTFILGWRFVVVDTAYTPWYMLGSGDEHLTLSDYPYTEMPKYLKLYYVASLSYYIEDLLVHLFTSPSSDFFEIILHHLVTIGLIVGSFLMGYWPMGI